MQVSASGSADFTGVFVKWQYQPGQKYIQLLFETAAGMRLSLSRNRHFVRSLTVGRNYRIKGTEYQVAGKTYVHEPMVIPLPAEVSSARKHRRTLIIAALLSIFVIGGVAVVAGHSTPQAAADTNKPAVHNAAAQATLASHKVPAAQTADTAAAAQTTAAAPVSSSSKTVAKAASPAAVSSIKPSAQPVQPQPLATPPPAPPAALPADQPEADTDSALPKPPDTSAQEPPVTPTVNPAAGANPSDSPADLPQ